MANKIRNKMRLNSVHCVSISSSISPQVTMSVRFIVTKQKMMPVTNLTLVFLFNNRNRLNFIGKGTQTIVKRKQQRLFVRNMESK